MSFGTSWQEGRLSLRCPCCGKLICTEPPGSRAELRVVRPVRNEVIEAQTLISCRCKNLLEIRRPAA